MKKICVILLIAIFMFLYGCAPNEKITISFETNGANLIEDIVIDSSLSFVLPDDPIKEGYTFMGWYLDNETFAVEYSNLLLTNSLTLYAKWLEESVIENITISFETNGANLIEDVIIDSSLDFVLPDDPIKEGYTFVGWYLDNETFAVEYSNLLLTNSLTLYAKWEFREPAIMFETNGGNKIEPFQFEVGVSISKPINPIKEGCEFAGWYSDIDLTEVYEFNVMPEESITLYADWGTTGLAYTLINTEAGYAVSAGNAKDLYEIQIPNIKNDLKVTQIKNQGFINCKNLEKIIIPKTIIFIPEASFYGCGNIIEMTLPFTGASRNATDKNGLFGYIFGDVFYEGSKKITHSYFSEVLYNESSNNDLIRLSIKPLLSLAPLIINDFYIPAGLNKIIITDEQIVKAGAFSDLRDLSYLELNEGITKIEQNAFGYCGVKGIEIPKSVTDVAEFGFLGADIVFKEGINLKTIKRMSFYAYLGSELTIPSSVTKIEERAFYFSMLEEVYIPDSVVEIENWAFAYSNIDFYVEAESKPDGWSNGWNLENMSVVWGYKGD